MSLSSCALLVLGVRLAFVLGKIREWHSFLPSCEVFQNGGCPTVWGSPFGGSKNKDYVVFGGSIRGTPLLGYAQMLNLKV